MGSRAGDDHPTGRQLPNDDQLIAVITHGWFVQYLTRAFIGWLPDPDGTIHSWFELKNTVTALLQRPGVGPDEELSICLTDRIDHLPRVLVTR